jgi:N-acetylneuraminic acid mutarotase
MDQHFRRAVFIAVATTSLIVGPGTVSGAPLSIATRTGPVANTFVPTSPMHARRAGATSTVLGDGDVLVVGGGTAAAELYHPQTGTWSVTASMTTVRTDATATLLPNGDVLVAGGCCQPGNPYRGLTSAELYHPATRTWSTTGSLNVARSGDTATLLEDGDVLVAGGACNGTAYGCDAGSFLSNLKSAELYHPATGIWTKTGTMHAGREFQTATLLPNGEVLVVGGFNSCDDDFCSDLNTAELYDPVTGKWLHTGSMRGAREQQTATLLADGDVLVAGGLNQGGFSGFAATYASAELYNPLFGKWSPTGSMNQARAGQTATLVEGGWVLLTGGGTSTSEVYQPTSGIWVPTGDLSTARTEQTAALLGNGDVLVAGGSGPDREPLGTAEVYQAGAGPLVRLSVRTMSLPTQQVGTNGNGLSFTVTNGGTAPLDVLGVATGGANPADFEARSGCEADPVAPGGSCIVIVRFAPLFPGLRSAIVELADNAPLNPQGVRVSGYGAGPDVWVPTGSMLTPRTNASATLLADGHVLVAGGQDFYGNTLATAEVYDPATGSFAPTGSLGTSREFQAAARLPNGDVLVAGGFSATATTSSLLSSAEIYHPTTGAWTPTSPLPVASDGLTATELGRGLVLVTGFNSADQELYTQATGSWSPTGPLPVPGAYALVALLHSGLILLTGGPNGASALYHPTTNSWSVTASLDGSRHGATATVLSNGDVLVVGGFPDNGGNPLSSSRLYDPATGKWTAASSLPVGRAGQSAVLLPNGSVLVAGGCDIVCANVKADESSFIYNNGYFSQTASLPNSRIGPSTAALPNGDVLLAGGAEGDSADATATAELYLPPVVQASPNAAAAGQKVTVTGNGFYAHEIVVVSLTGATFKVLAHPTTGSKGAFRLVVTVPALSAGTYQLAAQGQTSFAYTSSTFVIRST